MNTIKYALVTLRGGRFTDFLRTPPLGTHNTVEPRPSIFEERKTRPSPRRMPGPAIDSLFTAVHRIAAAACTATPWNTAGL
jgi:hypothetical protein